MTLDEVGLLEQAWGDLSGEHRRLLALRYRDRHSFEEIARASGQSPAEVRRTWFEALEALAQSLVATP